MTLEEMLQMERKRKKKQKYDDEEHRIQCSCVKWFNLKYPKLKGRLFAVPNGGRRDTVTGGKLKAEGVTAGVSDLILLKFRTTGELAFSLMVSVMDSSAAYG